MVNRLREFGLRPITEKRIIGFKLGRNGLDIQHLALVNGYLEDHAVPTEFSETYANRADVESGQSYMIRGGAVISVLRGHKIGTSQPYSIMAEFFQSGKAGLERFAQELDLIRA